MKVILETVRLRLREFNLQDAAFIIELLNSAGWIKFIGDRNVKTLNDAEKYLENGPLKSYREFGYGLSMVELKSGNSPIGMCGIINRAALDVPDIGFAFLPNFEGKGYGFEIAYAIMKHARVDLKLTALVAISLPANVRSVKLLEKLGFKFLKTTVDPVTAEELLLYKNDVV